MAIECALLWLLVHFLFLLDFKQLEIVMLTVLGFGAGHASTDQQNK